MRKADAREGKGARVREADAKNGGKADAICGADAKGDKAEARRGQGRRRRRLLLKSKSSLQSFFVEMSKHPSKATSEQVPSPAEFDPGYARYLLWLMNGGTPGASEVSSEVPYCQDIGRRVEVEAGEVGRPDFSPEFVRKVKAVVRRADEEDRCEAEAWVKIHKKPDNDAGPSRSTRSRTKLRSRLSKP